MGDLLHKEKDSGPPKKEEIPEPVGDRATPASWAKQAKFRRYRAAMKFGGIALDAEITKNEFDKAVEFYKKIPGNWYSKLDPADLKDAARNPAKYIKKVVK